VAIPQADGIFTFAADLSSDGTKTSYATWSDVDYGRCGGQTPVLSGSLSDISSTNGIFL
jgi:hypothetical protein